MDECYACVVGVWTGPESHSEGCSLARVRHIPTEHRIHTEHEGERAYWECSCGRGGSAEWDRVDLASDKHIPEGDRRVDTTRPFDLWRSA
jgi:hypothetical protein